MFICQALQKLDWISSPVQHGSKLELSSDEESEVGLVKEQILVSSSSIHSLGPLDPQPPFFRRYCKLFCIMMILNFGLALIVTIIGIKNNGLVPTFWIDYLSLNRPTPKTTNLSNLINYRIHPTGSQTHQIHSHNDYWRKTPLFDALSLGINSVEADVWYLPHLNSDELYVGHKRFFLSRYRTLDSLYLSNIETLLDDANANGGNQTLKGVFPKDPTKPLDLVIDIKTEANSTFQQILTEIQPLIEKRYITHYNTIESKWYYGPLTVHISGNIPFELIQSQEIRYTFIDAKLELPDFTNLYTKENSIYSSSSLKRLTGSYKGQGPKGTLSQGQLDMLKEKFQMAHDLGIKTRVWDIPKHPQHTRDEIWTQLLELGGDMVNADDLQGAVQVVDAFNSL